MKLPIVSILLVIRNEKDYVLNCIDSIIRQDYPRENMELLFIDGCSEDGTHALLEKQVEELNKQGYETRLFRNDGKILASGWNLGIREAQGEYICRIDAHSEIMASYISTGIKCMLRPENERVAAVGGWLKHAATTRTGHVIAVLLSSKFAVGNSPFRQRPDQICNSDTATCGIYRRSLFSEIGFFDEELQRNQDMVMHQKFKSGGYTFLTHPQLEIKYYVRSTLGSLTKKAFGDGKWVALAGSKNFSLRHKIPYLFVLYLIMLLLVIIFRSLLLISLLGITILIPMTLPIILYMVLATYFAMKTKSAVWERSLLIPLFFIFHATYGIGTIYGYCIYIIKSMTNNGKG